MTYKPQCYEIAGVNLIGYRQADGSVVLGDQTHGTHLPDFPEDIDVEGVTYSLEYVRKNREESPDIVVPGHPGYPIEWGIYV